ncbi:MAG: hypothetical protein LBS21_09665 [Clostridiales bacterium]|jgi:outer membrane lipoprotein-sorting protein|nr:hypothetical protein [Clostridiales bacterium]
MKRIIALCLLAVFTVSGCGVLKGKPEELSVTAYEKIQKALVSMTSYQAAASVTYVSNKGSNDYETFHQCRSTGEYRITVTGPEKVAGNVTVSDGTIISQFNPKISGKISVGSKESYERSEILITSFVKNYLSSQDVTVAAAALDESICTVLEAVVPGEHPYLATEKLWVDNETSNPVKLVVYDKNSVERIIVNFTEFQYNVELDDTVFKANI